MTNKISMIFISAIFLTTGLFSLSAGEILAAWDSWPDPSKDSSYNGADITADHIAAGLSLTGTWQRGAKGSTDETFGTIGGAKKSSTAANGYLASKATDAETYIEFTVTNNRQTPVAIEAVHFDLQRQWSNAPRYYRIESMGSGIPKGLIAKGQLLPFENPLNTDYADIDAPVNLQNTDLAPGKSVTFRLTVSGGKGTAPIFIDNFAVTEK